MHWDTIIWIIALAVWLIVIFFILPKTSFYRWKPNEKRSCTPKKQL